MRLQVTTTLTVKIIFSRLTIRFRSETRTVAYKG